MTKPNAAKATAPAVPIKSPACAAWSVVLGAVLSALSPSDARGGEPPRPDQSGHASFFLDVGAAARLNFRPSYVRAYVGGVRQIHDSWKGVADLGLLIALDSTSAWGPAIHLSGDEDGGRFGAGLRCRRKLSQNWRLDLTGGVLIASSSDYDVPQDPGFYAQASARYRKAFAVGVQVEQTRYEHLPTDNSIDGTLMLTSKPALGVVGLALIAAVVGAIALGGSGGGSYF